MGSGHKIVLQENMSYREHVSMEDMYHIRTCFTGGHVLQRTFLIGGHVLLEDVSYQRS